MRQDEAEKHIKRIQREFLLIVEGDPLFDALAPTDFDDLRKAVFRGTFQAYRLGVVGLSVDDRENWRSFFTWLDDVTRYAGTSVQVHASHLCFRTALQAFRIGAMVAANRGGL